MSEASPRPFRRPGRRGAWRRAWRNNGNCNLKYTTIDSPTIYFKQKNKKIEHFDLLLRISPTPGRQLDVPHRPAALPLAEIYSAGVHQERSLKNINLILKLSSFFKGKPSYFCLRHVELGDELLEVGVVGRHVDPGLGQRVEHPKNKKFKFIFIFKIGYFLREIALFCFFPRSCLSGWSNLPFCRQSMHSGISRTRKYRTNPGVE